MSKPNELFYVALPAPDLTRSATFYGKVLGWQVGGGSQGGHVNNTTTPCGFARGQSAMGGSTVYFVTKPEQSLEEAMELVTSNGGKVERVEDYGFGRCAFCNDNQGTAFCLQDISKDASETFKTHAVDPAKGSLPGDLLWFSLGVAGDGKKAQAFYKAVLGWEFSENITGDESLRITNLRGPTGQLDIGKYSKTTLWFQVDDLETARATIQQAGGKAQSASQGPYGLCSECVDDQGAAFGIVYPSS